MKKRLIGVLLACVLAVGATACGPGDSTQGSAYGGQDQSVEQQPQAGGAAVSSGENNTDTSVSEGISLQDDTAEKEDSTGDKAESSEGEKPVNSGEMTESSEAANESLPATDTNDDYDYYEGDGSELKVGDRAPWFQADLVDGGTFDLKDALGKVVIVNCWATWCGPCCREMPAFQWLYEEYPDTLAVVCVDMMESKKTVNDFVAKAGYTFPIAYDTDGSISMKYPTDGIPYTVIIGADGYVKYTFLGAVDAETQYREYKDAIDSLLD